MKNFISPEAQERLRIDNANAGMGEGNNCYADLQRSIPAKDVIDALVDFADAPCEPAPPPETPRETE